LADKKLFDVAPFRHTEWIDEPDNTISITTHQDAEPILNQNKIEYNGYGDKLSLGKRGDWHHAARIPKDIWDAWLRETNGEVAKDPKILAAKLNDPDNKFLKTAPTNL